MAAGAVESAAPPVLGAGEGAAHSALGADESDADDSVEESAVGVAPNALRAGESDAGDSVEESAVAAVGAARPSEAALLSLCFLKCACKEFYADADSNGQSCGSGVSRSEVCGCR